jgi:hypothetical protein
LNSLFGFFGFCALLYTIHIQQRELGIASEQMRLSTKALEDQGRAQKEQEKSFKQQNFEQTFFQTLQLHTAIITGMEGPSTDTPNAQNDAPVRGRAYLRQIYRYFIDCYDIEAKKYANRIMDADREGRRVQELEIIKAAYQACYEAYRFDLSHYFEHVHAMLYVLNELPKELSPQNYTIILRAQLSTFEILLLFYHALWQESDLKSLIEKYRIFYTIDWPRLAPSDLYPHIGFYKRAAYHQQLEMQIPEHISSYVHWYG